VYTVSKYTACILFESGAGLEVDNRQNPGPSHGPNWVIKRFRDPILWNKSQPPIENRSSHFDLIQV
jgi:hypothetical protein